MPTAFSPTEILRATTKSVKIHIEQRPPARFSRRRRSSHRQSRKNELSKREATKRTAYSCPRKKDVRALFSQGKGGKQFSNVNSLHTRARREGYYSRNNNLHPKYLDGGKERTENQAERST